MLAVFRYSFKRMIYSKSTLIITLICLGFYTLFVFFTPFEQEYTFDVNSQIGVLSISFINNYFKTLSWFVLPIFCATKINNVIAEERENETLLLVIAKPVSKIRFVLEKLLAYFVLVLLWSGAMTSTLVIMFYMTRPHIESISFVNEIVLPIFSFNFLLTLIFTGVYFVISLYRKPSFNIASAFLLSFVFSFFDGFSKNSILKNQPYQNYGGKIVPRNEVEGLKKGANEYKTLYKYFNAEAQWLYLYYQNLLGSYSKYGITNPSVKFRNSEFFILNKEPILKELKVLQKDKLNKQVFKNEFVVVGYEEWFNQRNLFIFYSSLFALSIFFGLYAFWKKDIF